MATAEFSKFAGKLSTFRASSFRIWKSSTGIPLPSLASFVIMLHKAYLTLDSRMSDSRWVITPMWLSGSWRSVLYSAFVYSCQFFLISSAFFRSVLFFPFIRAHLYMKYSLGISNFLEEISSLFYFIVFLYFFALFALFLHSLHYLHYSCTLCIICFIIINDFSIS